jgi:hypothetical protein
VGPVGVQTGAARCLMWEPHGRLPALALP